MIYLNAASVPLSTSAAPTRWFVTAGLGTALYGTAGADYLSTSDPTATLVGGQGDDTYAVASNLTKITETAGGGIDTVQSWAVRFTLPANVENLQLMQGNEIGIGNALNNIITASGGPDTLDGGAGNDVLLGGAGADTFVIAHGNGSDVIVNFTPGVDRIWLEGYALYSFAAVQAAMSQTGPDTTIALGGGESLVLRNVKAASIGTADVWLSADPSHAGMTQTFDDEFTSFSASATGIGTTWKTSLNIANELRTLSTTKDAEFYSDSSVGVNPFSLGNGVLAITASAGSNPLGLPYNSGVITTAQSFAQEYGYFEVRAQLPAGQGFWPAFWMLPENGTWPPEIDVFEVLGNNTSTLYASLHSTTSGNLTAAVSNLPDLSAGFHTYGLSWQADTIRWYVDGNEVAEAATPADMHQPMYMLLNLGVGGAGSWPGQYAANLPTGQMLIDYVHAWQYNAAVVTSSANVPGSGGVYTLKADGVSDIYDFSHSQQTLELDAAGFSLAGTHTIIGSPLGSEVHGGPGTVNFVGGAAADTFTFGTGLSRVQGGGGNDVFVFAKGAIVAGDQIIDFHLSLASGGEHDTLRLQGFAAGAHLDWVATSGALQTYHVVDAAGASPTIYIQVVNGSAHLGAQDVVFA